jgi:hypothetical protein
MAGTTTNFAIPYPSSSDYVTDGATAMQSLAERSDLSLFAMGMGRNRLINGDMRVAQRGTSFVSGANNDDTYNLDRWTLLSDGNDIVDVTQANVAPSGGLFSIGLDVETINKKFGIIQIIEQSNIVGMLNQSVTLSFSARTSGTSIANLKAVILAWNSTANTVTSDVVSAWGADGITPTFAANWTAENTPQNLSPSNTWTNYSITATLDTASTNNVAVFIWCDDTTTTLGDFLYITDVQLEVGALATPFERKNNSTVLQECQRYYENSGFPTQAVPTGVTGQGAWIPAASAYTLCSEPQFRTTKRAAPSVTIYNTNTSASGSITEYIAGGSFVTNRTSAVSYATSTKFMVNSAGQFAAGRDYNFSWEAAIEL